MTSTKSHILALVICITVLLASILWFKFGLCGLDWNRTCYGNAEMMTFTAKNVTSEQCDPLSCYLKDVWYQFESPTKTMNISGYYGTYPNPLNIYDYDVNVQRLQVGRDYPIFMDWNNISTILIPLSKGGKYDLNKNTTTVPTEGDYVFCILIFLLSCLAIGINLAVWITVKVCQRRNNRDAIVTSPGYAGFDV